MNLTELQSALTLIGIEPEVLSLGARSDYCWCVEQASDGRWDVYWYERGNKNNLVRLDSESAACFYLLGRLTYSQIIAGVIGRR